MFKTRIPAAAAACAFLLGCGSSMPGCEDAQVINLLKEIASEQNIEIVKLSEISTKTKNDTSCRCTALATVNTFTGQVAEPIQYQINLTADGNEFSVVMSDR